LGPVFATEPLKLEGADSIRKTQGISPNFERFFSAVDFPNPTMEIPLESKLSLVLKA
jgi:hypothetical protein